MLFLVVTWCFLVKALLGATLVPTNPSIIIIGSGPSGIAAATRLLTHNFTNIRILEAENRIGGRINSVYFGDGFVDMGAQFCHGEEDNIVHALVKDLNVLKHSEGTEQFFHSSGKIVDNSLREKILEFAESLEATKEHIDVCENVTSIGECLNIKFNNALKSDNSKIFKDSFFWIRSYLCALDSPFDLVDLKINSTYKKCAGDLHLNWNGHGYKTVLEVMMRKFPNAAEPLPVDDKILLKQEVVKVSNWTGDAVFVHTSNGSYKADHVIFTPSLGVLKHSHKTMFEPRLPKEKIKAIETRGFGAILKVHMLFSERWWGEDAKWTFIWSEEDRKSLHEKELDWLLDIDKVIQGENNPKVLIVWYAGSHVPLIETLSDQQVLDGQHYFLEKFFVGKFNVTYPIKIIRSSWFSNPHFKGTYSYESVKESDKLPEILSKPLMNQRESPVVLFAGEATHPYYFSTVHGAIESGYREANRLITLYSKEKILISCDVEKMNCVFSS